MKDNDINIATREQLLKQFNSANISVEVIAGFHPEKNKR
ncbi:hypothetical protein DR95_238 [Proteus vulgaris]|nr:hypothetical protein DR95_238 [Proteus vulgaris]